MLSLLLMELLVNRANATTLDDTSFRRVLNIYPEEELAKRKIFAAALRDGEIEFKDLKEEAEKIIIPWQMFFLEPAKLETELTRIEELRHKAAASQLAKRAGSGKVTSKRILDRLVRCHAYVAANHSLKKNPFCGSLRDVRRLPDAAAQLCKHFGIDMGSFRSKNKADALAYLIEKTESGQVNVCQGVLTNKILPLLTDSRSVYKNTSGFVIRDESLPFIFLPSEVNPDEREGRQILTLLYLLALIGLDAYDYQIERDFKVKMLAAKGREKSAYYIVSEFLLPFAETELLRGTVITADLRDELARTHKLTPTAVVVILLKREIISAAQYRALVPPLAPARGKKGGAPVPIESSVKKFNGKYACDYINGDFSSGKLTAVQAQYLLFGSINKSGFKKYKKNLGI